MPARERRRSPVTKRWPRAQPRRTPEAQVTAREWRCRGAWNWTTPGGAVERHDRVLAGTLKRNSRLSLRTLGRKLKIVEPEFTANRASGRNAFDLQYQQCGGGGSCEVGVQCFPEVGIVQRIAGEYWLASVEVS